MPYRRKFISIWNEIKKIPSFTGRMLRVDQLDDRRLLFYSEDKANPWAIDDREKNFITLHRKNYLVVEEEQQPVKPIKNLTVHYLKETECIRIYPVNTIWERANTRLVKNKIFRFFSAIWDALSAHANLLNWISLLFLFFSSYCSLT